MANSTNIVSYLILDSLSSGSKYGLEIIEHISTRTGGNYILKKPTLYSALTRMEKKGLVSSSYWETSDLGGKRHYYTITNQGRKELETLETEFKDATFDDLETETSPSKEEEKTESAVVGWQDSLFNLVEEPKLQKTEDTSQKENDVAENQLDIFSMPLQEETETQPVENEKMEYYQSILEQQPASEKSDDAVLLSETDRLTAAQEEQNKRLYDTSNDLKKYRKRKSFAENQIEMAVEYENDEDREIQKERIEQLKKSMLDARQNYYQEDTNQIKQQNFNKIEEVAKEETQESAPVDDAVFITSRYQENEIPVQRKITPPNIEISVTAENLPAPKRDTNLEPTYKDMMSKIFEHKKEKQKVAPAPKQTQIVESTNYSDTQSFVDYPTLKQYYQGHGIEFKEYKKTGVERVHNTNFLVFISSVVLLLLAGVGSAVLCGILAWAKVLNTNTNFVFYTVPLLFLLYTIVAYARHKLFVSKKASLMYNAVVNWAVFVLSTVVIVVINICCGMQYEIIKSFLSSILVPVYAVLLAFPVNYYIKKFLFKRYAK